MSRPSVIYVIAIGCASLVFMGLFAHAQETPDQPLPTTPPHIAVFSAGERALIRSRFSPDGEMFAVWDRIDSPGLFGGGTSRNFNLKVWNVRARERQFLSPAEFKGFQFCPDGKNLLVWNAESVTVIDIATSKSIATLDHDGVASVRFLDDGELLVTRTGGLEGWNHAPMKQRFWDTTTWMRRETGIDQSASLISPALTPDGKTLAAYTVRFTGSHAEPHELKIWDVEGGEVIQDVTPRPGFSLNMLGFAQDGKALAIGTPTADVQCWDLATKEPKLFTDSLDPYDHVHWSDRELIKFMHLSLQPNRIGRLRHLFRDDNWNDGSFPTPLITRRVQLADDRWVVWDVPLGKKLSEFEYVSGRSPQPGDVIRVLNNATMLVRHTPLPSGEMILWDRKSKKIIDTLATDLPISQMAITKDGRSLAVLCFDNSPTSLHSRECQVAVWDLESRKQRFVLKGHSGSISSVAFSPDGKILATGSSKSTSEKSDSHQQDETGQLKLWDVETGELLRTLVERGTPISCLVFTPDGKQLATGGDEVIYLRNATSGKLEKELENTRKEFDGGYLGIIRALAFSPDGKRLSAEARFQDSDAGKVALWNVETGEHILTRMAKGGMTSIRFPPKGKAYLLGGLDGLFELTSPNESKFARPDVRRSRKRFREFGNPPKAMSQSIRVDSKQVFAFHVGSYILATCGFSQGYTGEPEGVVGLWDVGTEEHLETFTLPTGKIKSMLFSPNGETLIVGSQARTNSVTIVDLDTGHELSKVTHDMFPAVSPDGELLATRSSIDRGEVMTLRSTRSGKELAETPHKGVWEVQFSPDGKTMATIGGNNVKLWDVTSFSDAK